MEEGLSQQCDLAARRDRFLWTVYHTGCPLSSDVECCWFLNVYIGGRIIICHRLSKKDVVSQKSTKLLFGMDQLCVCRVCL